MTKFNFRLQKVLDHKRHLEDEAKTAYLTGRALRVHAESELEVIGMQRQALYIRSALSLHDRLALEACNERLDDEATQKKIEIGVLEQDEDQLHDAWIEARKEVETLSRLRDEAFREWLAEAGRKEQAELDEWAVTRKRK